MLSSKVSFPIFLLKAWMGEEKNTKNQFIHLYNSRSFQETFYKPHKPPIGMGNSEFIIPQDNKSIFRYNLNVLMKRSSALLIGDNNFTSTESNKNMRRSRKEGGTRAINQIDSDSFLLFVNV